MSRTMTNQGPNGYTKSMCIPDLLVLGALKFDLTCFSASLHRMPGSIPSFDAAVQISRSMGWSISLRYVEVFLLGF